MMVVMREQSIDGTAGTESVDLRAMRWWDIPAVHTIEQQAFGADAWSVEQFWTELAQETRWYVVAESAGHVLGYGGLFCLPPEADVQTVAVAPVARGRGIGRALVEAMLGYARSRSCRTMMLEVRDDNAPAIALYGELGFVECARRARYYADGADARIMRMSFDEPTKLT